MRLALQRDVAAFDELAVELGGGVVVVDHAAAVLRHGVLEHFLAIGVVRDGAGSVHHHFGAHPLLAVERGRGRIQAMILVDSPLVHHFGAGAAHVGRGPRLAVALAAEELRFDGNGKGLVARHGARIGGVQHGAAVAERPGAGVAGCLVADEAVLDHQAVIGIGVLVEEVAELPVEALVFVVADLEQAVLDAEGVAVVVTEFVLRDLRRPAFQILAVEQDDPVFLVRVRVDDRRLRDGGGGKRGEQRAECEKFQSHVHSCLAKGPNTVPTNPPATSVLKIDPSSFSRSAFHPWPAS